MHAKIKYNLNFKKSIIKIHHTFKYIMIKSTILNYANKIPLIWLILFHPSKTIRIFVILDKLLNISVLQFSCRK